MSGVELIAAERKRQILDEGWSADHDDGHGDESLARAGACYAMPTKIRHAYLLDKSLVSWLWPWDMKWWKPKKRETAKGRIRELVKAGALIAAEIDRLTRQEPSHESN